MACAYHSGQVLPHFITASLCTVLVCFYIFMFDYAHLVVIVNLTLQDTLFSLHFLLRILYIHNFFIDADIINCQIFEMLFVYKLSLDDS